MKTRMENQIRSTFLWLTTGTLAYFFCQWLMTILVVRITNYSIAGDFALIISSTNIFAQIALFGMRSYQISDTQQKFNDKTYMFSRIITCSIALLSGIFFCLFSKYSFILKANLVVFLIYRITEGGFDVFHGVLQNASRSDIVGKSLIVRGIVPLILFGLMLLTFNSLLPALVSITLFSIFWIIIIDYSFAAKLSINNLKTKIKVSINDLKIILQDCLPIVLGNIVYSLILFIPRFYIEKIYGNDVLGAYASVSAPSLIIPLLAYYAYLPYMPVISELYNSSRAKQTNKLVLKLLLLICSISLFILLIGYLLGNWGLVLLFGESIRAYSYLLVPILLNVICTAFVYFFNSVAISFRKSRIIILSSFVAVCICFIVTPMFVNKSLNGASYALIVAQLGQLVVLVSAYYLYQRKLR